MKAGVLFSGGKDSALSALLLSRDYTVELNTFVFDPDRDLSAVEKAAEALELPLKKRIFRIGLMEEVIPMLVEAGYPNDAINFIHRQALHTLCEQYPIVADGTRLNDRVPMLDRGEVQSLEARFGCAYIRPLLGFGKHEIERLAGKYFVVDYGETGEIENGDYEHEIRAVMEERNIKPRSIFPPRHQQSLVVDTNSM